MFRSISPKGRAVNKSPFGMAHGSTNNPERMATQEDDFGQWNTFDERKANKISAFVQNNYKQYNALDRP